MSWHEVSGDELTHDQLDEWRNNFVAFDTETHQSQPGLKAPPLVCASVALWDPAERRCRGRVVDAEAAVPLFRKLLAGRRTIVGANIAFDMLVMVVAAAKRGIDLVPEVFRAYDEDRVFDVQIAEALHGVAQGTLGLDPRTARPIINPDTGKRGRYSLASCVEIVLGRRDAKANNLYRRSYALLAGIPIADWPEVARQYPIDDAENTLEVALAQCGLVESPGPHEWDPEHRGFCTNCGTKLLFSEMPPCRPRMQRRRNLHDHSAQVYTHWAMHLGAAWGFLVDQGAVDELERKWGAGREERAKPFLDAGILKWKRERGVTKLSRDMATIKRMVARAYGCTGACAECDGTGKVPSPKTKGKTRINCRGCGATGYDLTTAHVPMTTPKKSDGVPGVSTKRDALTESGDETLAGFGLYSLDAKIGSSYIPWLRTGRVCTACGQHGTAKYPHALDCPTGLGRPPAPPDEEDEDDDTADVEVEVDDRESATGHVTWRCVPLTLSPNPILETGRTSYDGVVQLLPRAGGVRECVVARPGRVFCSVDYEAGELVTHAQSCLWIVGRSELARALLSGVKPHNKLAAQVLGVTYDEFQRRLEAGDVACKDARQAAKPPNFGFPGRMGPLKLVQTQRRQGPDTPCPNGPATWEDEDGNTVRGYKGLRFCILMDGADRCGAHADGTPNLIYEYNDSPCDPTCAACVDCAKRLKVDWLKTWPENEGYFAHVSEIERGSGEVVHHVSQRVRGALHEGGNAIANGYFQGLLADASKAALRRVSREMYVDRASPLYGSRFVLFAHDELIAELPEDRAHEAAHRLSEIMVEEVRRYCPDLAPSCAAEPALMRRWYKGAAAVYRCAACGAEGKKPKCKCGGSGRLVPWEPKKKG